jgi:hypothetical protein
MFQFRGPRERLRRRMCTLQLDSMLLAHSCTMQGDACDVHSLNAIVYWNMHVYLKAKQQR